MDDPDRWIARAHDAYAQPLPDEPGARARVLERVRREREANPRPWVFRALHVPPLAAAAALVVTLALGAAGGATWMAARVRMRATAPSIVQPAPVTFVFRAPGASRVALVGDFNGWDPEATPLRRAALGDAWTAQVSLGRGLHAYAFVIDGREWSPDPSAPLASESAYGRRNSVVVVGEGGAL